MTAHQSRMWLWHGFKTMIWLIALLSLSWASWSAITRLTAQPVKPPDIKQSFEASRQWIQQHEAQILGDNNGALWWMLRLAAEKSHDPYLMHFYAHRMATAYEGGQPSMWENLIVPGLSPWINAQEAAQALPYQQFILYGATCNKDIGDLAGVRQNASRWFCKWALPWAIFRDPACSSHQLMGVLLIKTRHCQASFDVPTLERQLMSDIRQQLVADPRVKDAYIQRVMIQALSGGPGAVDQVALRRVLQAQGKDGGWSNQHLLWDDDGARYLAFSDAPLPLLTTQRTTSNAHATIQGLLLMALTMALTMAP